MPLNASSLALNTAKVLNKNIDEINESIKLLAKAKNGVLFTTVLRMLYECTRDIEIISERSENIFAYHYSQAKIALYVQSAELENERSKPRPNQEKITELESIIGEGRNKLSQLEEVIPTETNWKKLKETWNRKEQTTTSKELYQVLSEGAHLKSNHSLGRYTSVSNTPLTNDQVWNLKDQQTYQLITDIWLPRCKSALDKVIENAN